jgi:hypothetical protein
MMPDAASGRDDAAMQEDEVGVERRGIEQALIIQPAGGSAVDGFALTVLGGVGMADALFQRLAGGE